MNYFSRILTCYLIQQVYLCCLLLAMNDYTSQLQDATTVKLPCHRTILLQLKIVIVLQPQHTNYDGQKLTKN